MKKTLPLLLVGGGSGGHIYPLLAIADFLIDQKKWKPSDIHFVIANNKADFRYLQDTEFSYSCISVAKLRRYFSWENFLDFFKFFTNIIWAFFFLWKKKPVKIFSKGGFVSLPIGVAAFVLRIPFYLHETDHTMGLSNKILSRIAKKVFTGFPPKNLDHIFVGNPVRKEFFQSPQNPKDRKGEKIKILIFGGSQGAQALNEWGRRFFGNQNDTETLIITGKGKKSNTSIPHITEKEFLKEGFIQAVHKADIVITRAGGSISELSAAGKCTILIPLPSAANNHQRKNAQYFSDKNSALWIEESELNTDLTSQKIENLLQDASLQKEYATNLRTLATPNTVQNIVNELYKND